MNEAIQTAVRCFQENLRDFAQPQVSPEKYNLYNGLANLSEAIGALEAQVAHLRAEVERLKIKSSIR